MHPVSPVVFLVDVDNTLLDNDGVIDDMRRHLAKALGAEGADLYWREFEAIRTELGYADYLGALQRYRLRHPHECVVGEISSFLLKYPFADRVYPGALDLLARMASIGTTVILTDGDVVFQPWKVERSGIGAAVDGRVLIYVHKEHELAEVERRYPAERYVLVDDKLRILSAVKAAWGDKVTTVFPRQGHYALDPAIIDAYPAADVEVERIGDLLDLDLATILPDRPR